MKQDVGAAVTSLQPKVLEVDARQLSVKTTPAEREHFIVSGTQCRLKSIWIVEFENVTVWHDLAPPGNRSTTR